MLSRVANSLYWMSRYIERAENTARLVDTSLQLLLDIRNLNEEHVAKQWLPIVQAAGDEEAFSKLHPRATGAAVTEFLVFQAENPNSIVQCISEARENARMVRDQITFELWEELNRLYLFVKSREARQVWRQSPSDFFSEIKAASMHLTGIAYATLIHNEGWWFTQAGRFLERADKTSRILDVRHQSLPAAGVPGAISATEALEWSAILRSCSAWDAYKSLNGADVHPVLVTEFLVLSEDFPRSIRFCVAQLNTALRKISGVPEGRFVNDAERHAGRLLAELQFSTVEEIFERGLHAYMDDLQIKFNRIGNALFEAYFFLPLAAQGEADFVQQEEQQQQSIHAALYHKTRYTYDRPTGHSPHVIRLRPAPHCRAAVLSYSQKITGGGHFVNWQQDPFSNWNARVVFPEKMTELCVEVELVVEMAVHNPFDFFLEPGATHYPFTYDDALKKDLAPFLEPCAVGPRFSAWLRGVRQEIASQPLRTSDLLVALNQRARKDVKYLIRLEPGVQTPEETLAGGSGSCRDSAWLLAQLLRHLGLAARFVSGYLVQLASDEKSLDGPSGPEKDFTDLHAWCEVYLPGAGWIGLDATSGLLAGEGHIPLSCTPEPSSAAPISGAVEECEAQLLHEMRVTRIYESPRVTRPYSDAQWERIQALGHAVDAELAQHDVRLTMGGEPTFVSMDDPDGAEWNFTAVSHKKRVLAGNLIRRLRAKFAPGALLHYGQGKWYPGESLPRWALGCYWRKDGVPVWRDDSLIADESRDYGFGPREARELALRIAANLGVESRCLIPAYEDVFYYTWKERRLPSNVSPEKSNLKNKEERDRLAQIFQKGLGAVTGYALPLKRRQPGEEPCWVSGPWFLRDDEVLWLIPGDSPMGLRLPMESLPWVAESEYPRLYPPDPGVKRPPLPADFPSGVRAGQRFVGGAGAPWPSGSSPGRRAQKLQDNPPGQPPPEDDTTRRPAPQQSAPWLVRTALCVEPRRGRLHVFLPPVATIEDYLDMVAGIEAAVKEAGMPVLMEGEAPPRDPRLNKLAVTPDPGVIEVNLHPSATWDELVSKTTVLYEEARQSRLRAEKFMLDGRHTGTGGGNHLVIGGPTPSDSPILRRPDLLKSLLTYWQNHPSLSWLFSGLFIGPTSQAPRVDEARHDSLYELELAFQQVPGAGKEAPPWLADRLFRNLLIDASGNTHRAEFSIDKLFPPESAGGRLGLLEMRAFEMPPHARMSAAQQLLLRGLIARFWRQPCANRLVRWGTDIHDRWMLPHFCETDFADVIADLRRDGCPFEAEWFAPHFEFRFPRIGQFAQRDIQVELRAALEPWHVLGEESGAGGAVRYVDSSLERLQVKTKGMAGDRFVITCNGRRVPLHPTGTNGEFVAGVRYRAWHPPECLQPNIGVHTPLVFDLYDTWNGRSLGGCTYHVAHPGGRNYVTFPVNAYEAESRRLSRFFAHGHKQGRFQPPAEPVNRDFPFTLDLRVDPAN